MTTTDNRGIGVVTGAEETTVTAQAELAKDKCICQEEAGAAPCDCATPVTREQVDRLRTYLTTNTTRTVIYSELANEWMAALDAFLPVGPDPLEAWLIDPYNLPPAADLQHASGLGALLDMLGAPAVAV
jgi:hypothetical protein